MNDELFDSVMRIINNAPDQDTDKESYDRWIVESVVEWHDMKERNHDIVLLKKLSELKQSCGNVDTLELLKRVKGGSV